MILSIPIVTGIVGRANLPTAISASVSLYRVPGMWQCSLVHMIYADIWQTAGAFPAVGFMYLEECNVAADGVGANDVGVGIDRAHVLTCLRRVAVPFIMLYLPAHNTTPMMFDFELGSSEP